MKNHNFAGEEHNFEIMWQNETRRILQDEVPTTVGWIFNEFHDRQACEKGYPSCFRPNNIKNQSFTAKKCNFEIFCQIETLRNLERGLNYDWFTFQRIS